MSGLNNIALKILNNGKGILAADESTATMTKRLESVKVQSKGRHDPCVGIRAVPIAEAMIAIVLIDHFLRNRAQNADKSDSLNKIPSGE